MIDQNGPRKEKIAKSFSSVQSKEGLRDHIEGVNWENVKLEEGKR
jgi:hypothetical protein